MWIFYQARLLRKKHIDFVEIKNYIAPLKELMHDETIAKEANNLVYLSMANDKSHIDSNIIYSIFRKRPKRADMLFSIYSAACMLPTFREENTSSSFIVFVNWYISDLFFEFRYYKLQYPLLRIGLFGNKFVSPRINRP